MCNGHERQEAEVHCLVNWIEMNYFDCYVLSRFSFRFLFFQFFFCRMENLFNTFIGKENIFCFYGHAKETIKCRWEVKNYSFENNCHAGNLGQIGRN